MRRQLDRGSLSIEYVLVTPMIFAVFALIYAFGIVAQANGLLDAGTRDAARAASRANSYHDAVTRARQIIEDEISRDSSCAHSLGVQVTPSNAWAPPTPGQPLRTVTVRASCTYSLSDSVGGLPGSLRVTSRFSSPVDPNRTLG